jgi:hypothetical protein
MPPPCCLGGKRFQQRLLRQVHCQFGCSPSCAQAEVGVTCCAWAKTGTDTRCCSRSCMMQVQPHISWEECVTRNLKDLQVPTNMHNLKGVCELRGSWRCMLYKLTHPNAAGVPFRWPRASF